MFTIRPAVVSDLPELTQLFDAYRVFYEKTPDPENALRFLKERMERNESVIFVVETKESVLCGFVQLYPLFSSTKMQRLWLLNDLFVAPEFRGRHLSKRLMEAAQKHCIATNACGILLETAKTNVPGNALYPRMGFTADADHNYYFWNAPGVKLV